MISCLNVMKTPNYNGLLSLVPTKFFLTSGFGEASTDLNAFDAALLGAGVGDTNLVKLSSILPPGAIEVDPYDLPKGSFVPLAYGSCTCSEPGTVISAAVAVGIPEDASQAGLIMECAGKTDQQSCEDLARNMVMEGMETIRGLRIRQIRSVSTSLMLTDRPGTVFAATVLSP